MIANLSSEPHGVNLRFEFVSQLNMGLKEDLETSFERPGTPLSTEPSGFNGGSVTTGASRKAESGRIMAIFSTPGMLASVRNLGKEQCV